MNNAYKFRIYPNGGQRRLIDMTFGHCRFVFNHYLNFRKDTYEKTGKSLGYAACCGEMTSLKHSLEWLREVDSIALQQSLRDLDRAYSNFFRNVKQGKKAGFPKYKSKRESRHSYRTCGPSIQVSEKHIKLPKLGLVRCKISKHVAGKILSVTISRTPTQKYFVSICCEDVTFGQYPRTGVPIGIDVGIKDLAVLSDGTVYANSKHAYQMANKLAKAQRRLSRKPKGSANYRKAKYHVAILHERVANQRHDTLHKLTTAVVRRYDTICIEDLAPSNMVKNHKLARSISDASWGELRRQLTYKAERYGRTLVAVNRFFPSSQQCSNCHEKWDSVKDLKVRHWTCPNCGHSHDRDLNAAKNILAEGMRHLKA